MSDPETPQPEMDQKHKGQPIGEGLLIGVGQELGLSIRVDGCPLVGREFVLLNMLVSGPGEALMISNHLKVYLEVLQGIDLIPIVVGDRAEFASPLLRFGELTASQDITDGVLTGSLWERRRVGGRVSL